MYNRHRGFKCSAVPVRFLVVIWAGMVFCGTAQSQGTPLEDTIHLFKTDRASIRLEFEDALRISSLYDSADKEDWHYIYRWNTGERTDNIQVRFNGKRKVLYIAQRLSSIHWPEEYDTFSATAPPYNRFVDPMEDTCIVCAPEMDADTILYEWWRDQFFKEKYPDTERCVTVYKGKGFTESNSTNPDCFFFCQATLIEGKDTTKPYFAVNILYNRNGIGPITQTRQETRRHDYNIWSSMLPSTRLHARLRDTIHFTFQYPNEEELEIINANGAISPYLHSNNDSWRSDSVDVYFKDTLFRQCVLGWIIWREYNWVLDKYEVKMNEISHYVYWGIKPNAQIESDSLWVFFPQYPYSDLGGRVDLCLPPGAPLPAPDDTMRVFNLGPYNRDLDYVVYAWIDGTKDAAGRDSVVGTDSAFAYLFGRMDSVGPELYAGMLVTRVAADSLWQDSCGCHVPCTDNACHRYDTVRIYLHRLPLREQNFFLPKDSILCAHLDLNLELPDESGNFHCFWLDRDSIVLPFGEDTNRFAIQGLRGTDGFGAGTDSRNPRFFQLRLDHKICGVSFFDTLLLYDQIKPAFELPFHDTVVCLNEPVALDSINPLVYKPFYDFEWNDGTVGSGYSFSDSGIYVLRFFVRGDFDVCGYDEASDTLRVLWSDPALTLISIPEDTSFCERLSVTLDASVPFPSTRYCWQEGNLDDLVPPTEDSTLFTSPVLKVDRETSYGLFLLDTLGCLNAKQINIHEEDCKPKLEIPNVFTPNGDGVNDVWKFTQLEQCYNVDILVVDRKGSHVLHEKVGNADDFSWNGCLRNGSRKMPDGPYFYMVSYKDAYGKKKVQSGSVTILGTAE